MNAEPAGFDLGAAWARRANGDMRAFLEALAIRLEAALPGAVDVDRCRDGLFSRTSHVGKIMVRIQDGLLTLEVDHGRLRATRAKIIRGVTIGSAEIAVPAWLQEVLGSTRLLGEQAIDAHDALQSFLMS